MALEFNGLSVHLLISSGYAIVFAVLAAVVFRSKMRADLA